MKQLIPGVYYVKRRSGNQYNFEYWTIANMPIRKDVSVVIPVSNQRLYDLIIGILDESLSQHGFIDRMAFEEVMSAINKNTEK